LLFGGLSVAVAAAALAASWARLFVGMNLLGESYYVLVPWRWALGDAPFVNNVGLDQTYAVLVYPFVKLFALVTGNDATGIVLYTRHLYLLMMVGVAAIVFLTLRRHVRWQLALPASCVYGTWVLFATPQLGYNTICAALITVGAALGARVVADGKGRGYALASGAAFGIAVVAYPSLIFVVPFTAVFFVFAQGRRAVAVVAEGGFLHPPDPPGAPTGAAAWRALSAWVGGGLAVLLGAGCVMLAFGPREIQRSLQMTLENTDRLHQLGGASKALAVAEGVWRLFGSRPYLVVVALIVYLVFRRRPRLGRCLLAATPVVLWLVAQRSLVGTSGYVLVYGIVAPYLFLFVPPSRREIGARLLIWVWVPSVIAGAMTAYTSSFGYLNGAVGMMPALLVSGLFLAWALEAITASASDGAGGVESRPPAERRRSVPWLALVVLAGVVGVTISFQFQFQQVGRSYGDLTSRMDSGPWRGILVEPEQHRHAEEFAADLRAQGRPEDQLLVFDGGTGLYLYWTGAIASNYYWMIVDPVTGRLPDSTISYYRRHRLVPTLVVNLRSTEGMTAAELQASCAGLDFPPVLVRPGYAFHRKPADESTAEVLARLSRK
jgi:hypothetical protein